MSVNLASVIGILGLDLREFNQQYAIDPHIAIAERGLTKMSIENLKVATGMTWHQIASYLHINIRTIQRYQPQDLFPQDISERALRLADVYVKGEEVFGSMREFLKWLNLPIQALGSRKPKEFLKSSYGISVIMTELGRIEHGIFA